MHEEIVMAGFGGQGILFMGHLLSQAGMLEGQHVTWMPSYGPEMRGGTANCSVVISSKPISSPVVSRPDTVVAMNSPSVEKFAPRVKSGGLLLVNASLAGEPSGYQDIEAYCIRALDEAEKLGQNQVANMVMLGAYVALKGTVSMETLFQSLQDILPARRRDLLPVNRSALKRGRELVREGVSAC